MLLVQLNSDHIEVQFEDGGERISKTWPEWCKAKMGATTKGPIRGKIIEHVAVENWNIATEGYDCVLMPRAGSRGISKEMPILYGIVGRG